MKSKQSQPVVFAPVSAIVLLSIALCIADQPERKHSLTSPIPSDTQTEGDAEPTFSPVFLPSESNFVTTSATSGAGINFPADDNDLRAVQRKYNDEIKPILKQYCGDCHWGADADAGFNLESYKTLKDLLNARKKWKKVVVRVAAKEMPPADESEELPDAEHKAVLDWLDQLLNSVDCTNINPGRVTIRRLNRTEYQNTIRDLVGVDYKPARDFPGDDVGYGFDNIADVISLPPILMEKYLQAAEEITTEAIADPSRPAYFKTISGEQFSGHGSSREQRINLSSNGTAGYEIDIPIAGRYDVQIRAYGDQAGKEPVKMKFNVAGKSGTTKSVRETSDEPGDHDFKARLKKGKQRLEISFTNDYYKNGKDRNLIVLHAVVKGPTDRLPRSHQMLITETPAKPADQRVSARRILNTFTSRAYRRRATSGELNRLMALYDQARKNGETYELALRYTFQAVLISPYFLYKIEAPTAPGKTRNLTDFELATSLSYFLWSTMPDAELFKLAAQNKLRAPNIFRQQVQRMLKDDKADAMVENFVAQWLQLRHLEHFKPDPDMFPGIDEDMLRDMATETKLTIADMIKKNRSITDILQSDYTFINERLAKHYGLRGIRGEKFQKVFSDKTGRVGLMTHASILTLTSNPTRTSPVKRGKWIMENLLGEEPPPPDPAAMQLEDQTELKGTLRQRMEQHRSNPNCAVCHQVMDELGFALENYDAVGKWRDKEETNTIDARGELPDGTKFKGAVELQRTVQSKMQDQFVRCLTEKMLIYALGRGLEYFDECTLDQIIAQTKKDDYRFSEMIYAVVSSDPFRKRQGAPVDDELEE
ncbi:MAG: DUF1592 domain-containing protein [Mariniblastus sp.]